MHTIEASHLLIVEGIAEDPRTRERAERMREFIRAETVQTVSDAELNEAVDELKLYGMGRHGMQDKFLPVVIFNRFRFDDPPEVQARRREQFPALLRGWNGKLGGYGGFEWRDSGSAKWRAKTGCVCQPAYQLHTIVGCPFRCAYCGLGRTYNVMMNMEDFVDRLDEQIDAVPRQTLYQYDNGTDTVCFEPEYGSTKLLVEYFARKPDRYLELYVGKSDNVDFLLDYDHRGKTVACWSISGPTQSAKLERETADMEARIQAARKMQQAGYPVRVRFSPIIPVKDWEAENREMIERVFELAEPDVITFETLRFLDYGQIMESFDPELLDDEFLAVMKEAQGREHGQGEEIPAEYRRRVYRFIIDELERVSPGTPYAFCRETREMWDHFEEDFARHLQTPDRYVCNCGPFADPAEAQQVAAALQ